MMATRTFRDTRQHAAEERCAPGVVVAQQLRCCGAACVMLDGEHREAGVGEDQANDEEGWREEVLRGASGTEVHRQIAVRTREPKRLRL